MDTKLAKVYYNPKGYWKGIASIQKLADAAKVPEETAKQWLIKQALWQIDLPASRYIPRAKLDVSAPNEVHQADLLFLPHDKLPVGRKVYKYALTVVDVGAQEVSIICVDIFLWTYQIFPVFCSSLWPQFRALSIY